MAGINLLLGSLPGLVLEQFAARLKPVTFAAGHSLFSAGDRIENMYFIHTGAVSLVSVLSDGQTIETGMIGREGLVGGGAALDDGEAVYTAVVQFEASGLSLDMATASRLADENKSFRAAIASHEQLILAQAQQSAACNATHNLNQRLARWLLRVSDATCSEHFKVTQDLMAQMLGVGRTSVSIIAHSLQQAKLISYRRGSIQIENRGGLERLACECYETVKLRYQNAPQATCGTTLAGRPA